MKLLKGKWEISFIIVRRYFILFFWGGGEAGAHDLLSKTMSRRKLGDLFMINLQLSQRDQSFDECKYKTALDRDTN